MVRLISAIQKAPYAQDIIFAFFSKLTEEKIIGDSSGISWFFYKLKQKHPELFKKFSFKYSPGEPYPECEIIETTLSHFGLSKCPVLHSLNPGFHYWQIDKDDVKKFEKTFIQLDPRLKAIIDANYQEFNKILTPSCEGTMLCH